jgi:hypothetical protein
MLTTCVANEYILPAYKKHIDQFVAEGGDRSIPLDLLGVKAEYLQASFDEVKTPIRKYRRVFPQGPRHRQGRSAAPARSFSDRRWEVAKPGLRWSTRCTPG